MNYPELERVIDVVNQLRTPDTGCTWDLKQTHESLIRYLIEESYELVDAIQSTKSELIEEELGDVLLQVLLHSRLGDEVEKFNIESVAKTLADKMIRRHPHVFANPENRKFSVEEIKKNWQALKTSEGKTGHTTITHKDNLYPALFAANKIGNKTNKLNFDWDDYSQVVYKVEEEWQEVKEELGPSKKYNKARVEEELGDLLFSVAQLCRHLDINSEECLHKANSKFIKRFNIVEDLISNDKENILELEKQKLEEYWGKAKKHK